MNKTIGGQKLFPFPIYGISLIFVDNITPGKKTPSLYKYRIKNQIEHTITFEGITMREHNFVVRTRNVCSFDFWWWVLLSLNIASLL